MSDPGPQPAAPPPRPLFQFTLRTLLLLFVVLGSSLGVFGAWGIANCALVVGLAIFLHKAESLGSLTYPAAALLCLICLLGPLSTLGSSRAATRHSQCRDNLPEIAQALQSCLTWPNIAAVAVWLLSAAWC